MTTVPEQFVSNRPNTWTDWIQGLASIRPRFWGPTVAAFPELGDAAPSALGPVSFSTSTSPCLVAFVRHCGCPFAEKEVRLLAEASQQNPGLHVVIVQHSPEEQTKDWFERIGGHNLFPDPGRVTLVADPTREKYAAWGVGQLGWTQMVNGDVARKLHKQKLEEGLDITKGDWSNYRWQNSAGFAVDGQGKITWRKLATDSSDICDYVEAAGSLHKGWA
ncbi:hypothetical protein K461DRAFT_278168 [Myriangium duriaei CBS 260.36]|uniref:Thioredoxin domain-containing protein n=1 Tax=Myriangium duriaei CBS 260.36 TaxID=1168546 RepID=A0A9P4J3D4_9PEZI|nr:hypothetical protein K461DRAFT_278168 [Myriangium duriaei CBS 260.36]